MKNLYYFDNPMMENDKINEKGSITMYKKIALIGINESEARSTHGKHPLSNEWECVSVFQLSEGW